MDNFFFIIPEIHDRPWAPFLCARCALHCMIERARWGILQVWNDIAFIRGCRLFFFAQFGLLELRDLLTRIRVYVWFDMFTIVYGNTTWSHILHNSPFLGLKD